MQVTFIIRNLTDAAFAELAALSDDARFDKLHKWAFGDLRHCVSVKFGASDAFRDRVDFNTRRKSGAPFTSFKLEPRRGYKLATFTI